MVHADAFLVLFCFGNVLLALIYGIGKSDDVFVF